MIAPQMPIESYPGIKPIIQVLQATPARVKINTNFAPSRIAILPKMIDPSGLAIIEIAVMLYAIMSCTTWSLPGKNTGAIKGTKKVYRAIS